MRESEGTGGKRRGEKERGGGGGTPTLKISHARSRMTCTMSSRSQIPLISPYAAVRLRCTVCTFTSRGAVVGSAAAAAAAAPSPTAVNFTVVPMCALSLACALCSPMCLFDVPFFPITVPMPPSTIRWLLAAPVLLLSFVSSPFPLSLKFRHSALSSM